MRHPAAYYLLLLYCTVMVRCAMPVAFDALSHVFNEENHIATVHALYGNDHVEKEVASDENNSNKNQTGIKYEDQISVHLFAEAFTVMPDTENNRQLFPNDRILKLANIYLTLPFPPPKFS